MRYICYRFDFSEEITFEPITLETLRNEKGFQKTSRKQQKELDALRKKHLKEKLLIQKQQCTTIEKAIKGKRWIDGEFFLQFLSHSALHFCFAFSANQT